MRAFSVLGMVGSVGEAMLHILKKLIYWCGRFPSNRERAVRSALCKRQVECDSGGERAMHNQSQSQDWRDGFSGTALQSYQLR